MKAELLETNKIIFISIHKTEYNVYRLLSPDVFILILSRDVSSFMNTRWHYFESFTNCLAPFRLILLTHSVQCTQIYTLTQY